MGWFVFASLFVIPLGLWGVINPRSQWRALSAWQYRNPDANEPSDAAYAMSRFGSLVALGAWAALLVLLLSVDDPDERSRRNEPRTTYAFPSTTIPRPVDLEPLPVAGYAPSQTNPRSLTVVVRISTGPWWCRPKGRVVTENAQRIEVAVVMQGTPIGDDPPSCDGAGPTPTSTHIFLKQPLGKRAVVTRGPYADPAGKVHPAGPVRPLKVIPAP